MSKKTFRDDNPALAFITGRGTQQEQDEHDVQHTHDTHEVQKAHDAPRTQGRKGMKLQRINMAFSAENLEYLRVISRIEGESMTAYVNSLLDADRDTRAKELERAKKILQGVK